MKYFLIAGEPSGDQHGSTLMKAIRSIDPEAAFQFFGGDLMEETGGKAVLHIRNLAFMGFTQVVAKAFTIRENFVICQKAIRSFQPDVIIPIDYGGFNTRMIKWLKNRNYRIAYYITPKVWAWMPSRAGKLARYTDCALCVLPFEVEFLEKYGVHAHYVGNPVREYVQEVKKADPYLLRTTLELTDQPVIALLPGSRRQEIAKILPVMLKAIDQMKDYQIVIAGHGNFPESFYRKMGAHPNTRIIYGKTLELAKVAQAALVTSGTATLETALIGTPQVVCYKTSPISYGIARLLASVRFISLVNLILDKPCVQELIQQACNPVNVKKHLDRILQDSEQRRTMEKEYAELDTKLGVTDASEAAAAIICRMAMKS